MIPLRITVCRRFSCRAIGRLSDRVFNNLSDNMFFQYLGTPLPLHTVVYMALKEERTMNTLKYDMAMGGISISMDLAGAVLSNGMFLNPVYPLLQRAIPRLHQFNDTVRVHFNSLQGNTHNEESV